MESVQVNLNQSASLNSILTAKEQGFSVIRSAHVGNQRNYNLALAASGIDMLLVDHTITAVDKNYMPEALVSDGQKFVIAPDGQVTCRTKAKEKYLDELHLSSLTSVYGQTKIETNTTYLRIAELELGIVDETVRLCAKLYPELFERVVDKGSACTRFDNREASRLALSGQTLQLTSDPRVDKGVVIPNEVDILCSFVIELLRSERSTQLHISGPAMSEYLFKRNKKKGFVPVQKIQEMYDLLKEQASFGKQLPEQLTVELITGTALRFVSLQDDANTLDEVIKLAATCECTLTSLSQERKAFFSSTNKSSTPEREAFLGRVKQSEKACLVELGQVALRLPDLFSGPQDVALLTQYDIAKSNPLYIPEQIRDLSMAMLADMLVYVQKAKGALP